MPKWLETGPARFAYVGLPLVHEGDWAPIVDINVVEGMYYADGVSGGYTELREAQIAATGKSIELLEGLLADVGRAIQQVREERERLIASRNPLDRVSLAEEQYP